jgi:hypothetical protein
VAHKNPAVVETKRRKNKNLVWVAIKMILQTINDAASGVKQYPKTQTDWKKELKTKRNRFRIN